VLASGAATTGLLLVTSSPPEGPSAATVAAAHDASDADARRGTTTEGAPYAFWALDHRGAPLRWDACSPIAFVLNLRAAPAGAEQDVRTALGILAGVTGLDLVLEGLTDEAPEGRRRLIEPAGQDWRWRPVLVAWATPGEGSLPLTALDRGIALPIAVRDGDREAYVTGQVVLNAARTDLVPGFGDRSDAVGATLLHELAHLLGLDHVDDVQQLLSTDPGRGPVILGQGDLAGLERIGRAAGCNPSPPASAGRGLRVDD